MIMTKNTGIYVHIPFCVKKCKYCDFLSFDQSSCIKANAENIDAYFNSLLTEIRETAKKEDGRLIKSIFFGGGTPSMADSHYIAETLSIIFSCFHVDTSAEISIECNPCTITADKLADYKACGINRISIGLQSADNDELKTIGRIHTYEQFLGAYKLVRAAGFDNVNIDLMSALPGQTINSYVNSLEKIIELQPAHISAYSLILEENTPLYDMVYSDNSDILLPSEEDEREMYYKTRDILKANGYEQYEISNFARENKHCHHNCLYWERGEYFGFGLGAASYINKVRYKNISDFKYYILNSKNLSAIHTEKEIIDTNASMSEFMYLGLRFISGINSADFEREFGKTLEEVWGKELKKLISDKLIISTENGYKLTKYGIDVSNYVLSHFV